MVEDRHAAADGARLRARGGVCCLYRSSDVAQVVFDVVRTIRRQRQGCGDWKGGRCLCCNPVPYVRRQSTTISSSTNRRKNEKEKYKPCSTQGVGQAYQRLPKKGGTQRIGPAHGSDSHNQRRRLALKTPTASWRSRPFSLTNFL